MALDRVELVVIEVRRIYLPEKLLPADRRLSSRKLSFLLALQDVSQRLLNVLVVLASFDGVRVGTGQRCIEGILSRRRMALFASLSIRQVFAELKLLEPSLEHNDALQPTRLVLIHRKPSQPILAVPEDLNALQVRHWFNHTIDRVFLFEISEMGHRNDIVDTDELLIED